MKNFKDYILEKNKTLYAIVKTPEKMEYNVDDHYHLYHVLNSGYKQIKFTPPMKKYIGKTIPVVLSEFTCDGKNVIYSIDTWVLHRMHAWAFHFHEDWLKFVNIQSELDL